MDELDAEDAKQAEEAAKLLSSKQLGKARLCIIELEGRLTAQEITANIVQRTLEDNLHTRVMISPMKTKLKCHQDRAIKLRMCRKGQAVNLPVVLIWMLIQMLALFGCRVIMLTTVPVALQVTTTAAITSIQTCLVAWSICKIIIS